MRQPNPYTADFDFFDRLYGGQGEIFEVIQGPNISKPFHEFVEGITELQKEYPKERERLQRLEDLVCEMKQRAMLECFSAGVRETRRLLASLTVQEFSGGDK